MNHAIILAAGEGKRMKSDTDKLLLPVNGKPIIYYSMIAYNDHTDIDGITVVANKDNKIQIEKTCRDYRLLKVKKIVLGGKIRQESLENGLQSLEKAAQNSDIILVHNGANPLVAMDEITAAIEEAGKSGACIAGHKTASTVKEIADRHVIKTHDRNKIFLAETPQAANYGLLKKALTNARKKGLQSTDEAMMIEAIGQQVACIEADENNFKITTRNDYEKLKSILGEPPEDFRIGIGQDSHLFEEGKNGLVLAGIRLPNENKLQANSDGDVILHAVFNAISQAIGDRSLGFYADSLCEKGVKDSRKYLLPILKKVRKQGFRLNSLGLMLECKTPKIDSLSAKFKKSLSQLLDLDVRKIGITATSGDNATIFGEGYGIQCFAIVSLRK